MKRILCLWLPDWPVQRALKKPSLDRPLSPEAPIALHARDTRRGELIAACNQAAHQAGLRSAMPLAEARALLQHARWKSLVLPYDANADREALLQVAIHCERYSPLVGLGEAFPHPACAVGPTFDSLLLDITSIGVLFGSEDKLAAAFHADFASQGYRAHVAIADSVAAAWGLAHFAGLETLVVPQGWAALQGLPIAALRLSPERVTVLNELGIETVAHLAAIPIDALATRFGTDFVHQLQQAMAARVEMISPIRAPPEFHAEWLLEHPTTDRQALLMILEQLAQRVGDALRVRDQGALQLACRLDIVDSAPRVSQIGLYRPSADARHFLELLRLQGETLRLRGAVGRVGLAAMTTARLQHRQGQLFAGAMDDQSDELAALINRLSNRLGSERVTRPKPTRDVLPEQAYALQPLTGGLVAPQASCSRAATAKKAARRMFDEQAEAPPVPPHAPARPLSLLPVPLLLEAVSIAPKGPPIAFTYQGQRHSIARHWGPERIETAWWRGPSVRRDYYRVEVADGRRFWLFRELRGGKWFLHGQFD